MTQVVVAEFSERTEKPGRDLSVERSILGPDIELVSRYCNGDVQDLVSACRDADAILTDLVPLPRIVLEQIPSCRLISIAGTGYSNVDIAAATDAGISICALDDYCTDEVADHVMLLILALCRRLAEYHEQVQVEKLWQFDSLTGLSRLRDLTLGIVGFGRIGAAVARRASGFGMTLLAHDHHPAEHAVEDLCIQFCDLPTLLGNSDVISLNCNLSADNENLIDARAFAQMSRQPILINCARGGLVDEAALLDALDSGQISAAGLDVIADESPNLTAPNLVGRDNVILTPHMAFYSDRSLAECRRISANNIRNFLDGKHEQVSKYVFHAKY